MMGYGIPMQHHVPSDRAIHRLPFPTGEDEKPLVAVIVTINTGSSYDPLFREKEQRAPEGKVAVWELQHDRELLNAIHARFADRAAPSEQHQEQLDLLFKDIESVDTVATVFNFECCGGCADSGFPDSRAAMTLTKALIERGFMCMFSDFSLKALIGTWSQFFDCPNPLVKVGVFSSTFELRFNPATLADESRCPSAQLSKVGELCDKGEATVHAMGDTVCYSINPDVHSDAYAVEVLTVQTSIDHHSPPGPHVQVGQHKGAAGHAIIRFTNKGSILCSSGHWIELVRLDTSEEAVLRTAARTYGEGSPQYQQMVSDISSAPAGSASRSQQMQSYAAQMVQTSVPSRYTPTG